MKTQAQTIPDGGITTPRGFSACGVAAGIKAGRPDMALLYSSVPATVAAVFTRNFVQAAPVKLTRAHAAGGIGQAIVINSGNANACTGAQGEADAQAMAELTAQLLKIPPITVMVCSTGTIGRMLPMDRVTAGIRQAVAALSPEGGAAAARAIMTTDTFPKQTAVRLEIDGQPVVIGGMAKGAGMIAPNLATMLAFITTDAAVEKEALQQLLRKTAEETFNCVIVDGDQSTNDTLICLANGQAGHAPLTPKHREWPKFRHALKSVAETLAHMLVKDGEGATKFVTVRVCNARSRRAARQIASTVAKSLLVKTSWFGADPNWGRVICAVGYAGVPIQPELVDIAYDGEYAVRGGQGAGLAEDALHAIIKRPAFTITIDLHQGRASATVYTCDCSDKYVEINAAYMT